MKIHTIILLEYWILGIVILSYNSRSIIGAILMVTGPIIYIGLKKGDTQGPPPKEGNSKEKERVNNE